MNITKIAFSTPDNSNNQGKVLCYVSIILDRMIKIKNLRIIDGPDGMFVAMPNQKIYDKCHECGRNNHLRSRYCNYCGCKQDENRAFGQEPEKPQLYYDLVHPISEDARNWLEDQIFDAYFAELDAHERMRQVEDREEQKSELA